MVITEGVGVTLFGAIAAQTMPELAATFAIAGASANLAQQITGMMLHTQNSISIVQVLEAAGLDAITAGAAKVLDVPALLNKVNVSLGEKAFNYTKAFVELATLNAAIQEIEIKIGMRKSFDFKTMIINAAGTVLAAAITLEVKENTNNSDLADEIIHHATKGLLKLSVGVMMDEKTPMLFAKFLGDQAAMVANVGIHAKTKPVDYMATPQASPNDILYPQQTSFCKIPKAKQMTVANDDQYDLYKAYRSTTKIAQNEMFEASLSAKVANHSNWQAKLDQELYTHQHSAWAKGIMALAAMGSSNEMQTFTASGDLFTRDLMQFSAGHFGKKYFNDLENGTSTWSDATEFAEAATGMQMMGDIGADLIYKGFGVAKNVAGMFGGGVDVGEILGSGDVGGKNEAGLLRSRIFENVEQSKTKLGTKNSSNFSVLINRENALALERKIMNTPLSNVEVRDWYNETVAPIQKLEEQWIWHGVSLEDRALIAYSIRSNARLQAREYMSNPQDVELLQERDIAKYGNPNGPTYEYLYNRYQSMGYSEQEIMQSIIDNAAETNAEFNAKFTFR